MRHFIGLFFLAAMYSCSNPAPHVSVHISNDTPVVKQPKKEIACKLTSRELRDRKEQVLELLKKEVKEKKEVANGYVFKFDGTDAVYTQLTDFIRSERACCNFFVFSIVVADEESAIWLTITGQKGTKEFIQTEMGL